MVTVDAEQNLVLSLPRKAQRGSKPRCHLFTHGTREQVSARLTSLIEPWGLVSPSDRWMPVGFQKRTEAQLHKASALLGTSVCEALGAWWLPPDRQDALTPNWDIASTCLVGSRPGILLVEAKAHDQELLRESVGRKLDAGPKGDQEARAASHITIDAAINAAQLGLNAATGLSWGISRDSHYQMSNRFAWCWKLASLGIPVVLVYLGFLRAAEMSDKGRPFNTPGDWNELVKESAPGVPAAVWDKEWRINDTPFVPIIRSAQQPLPEPPSALVETMT